MATILDIDVEEIIGKLMQSGQKSEQLLAIIKAVGQFGDNGQNNNKTDKGRAAA